MGSEMNSIVPAGAADRCRFCEFLSNDGGTDPWDRPWLTDGRYSAVVSVGALTPGWSLVCPIEHKLNLSEEYGNDDFWRFTARVVFRLASLYGVGVACFEHGPSAPGSQIGCGTDHAHLHVVPLDFDLSAGVAQFDSSIDWRECAVSEIARFVGGKEYMFLATAFEGGDTRGYLAVLEEGRSQFFRRVIAKKLGIEAQYDYKKHPRLQIAKESANLLHAPFFERSKSAGLASISRAHAPR